MTNTQPTGCLAPQTQLQGRYSIIEMVGKGGMGSVYKAIDTQASDRLVAIKEMSQSHYRRRRKLAEAQELFQREAEILSNLSHPNLPHVYAFFNENERSYLVMDCIEGQTLEQLLKASATHRLPVQDVLRYALQLCAVLSYLHEQTPPIIFRDLKPANVMITATGRIYLIDFGIARVFKQGLTTDTQHLGTPGFASPEQHGDGQTGPRSDLYSLGATLHYCLTGKEPRTNKPTLFDFSPPHDLNPEVPLSLSELIQQLVATREEQRPPDAATVQHELFSIYKKVNGSIFNVNSIYYAAISHTTPFSSWITHSLRQLGFPDTQLISAIMRLLANMYGLLCVWLLQALLPRLKHIYRNDLRLPSSWVTELWQSLTTTEGRALVQAVWTPHFTFLFGLCAMAMTGGCLYMLTILHYSVYLVALYLCLLLLLLLGGAYTNQHIHHPVAQSILTLLILLLLLTATMLFALPEVQPLILATTFNQLLSICLVLLVIVVLLRPTKRLAWMDHLCLAIIAGTYALLLNSIGVQALQQILLLPMNDAELLNFVLICVLCIVTCMELTRCKYPFPWSDRLWGDRLQLFMVALIATTLQLVYGLQEIPYLPLVTFHTQKSLEDAFNLVSFNVLLAGAPVFAALLWLLVPRRSSSYVSRLPLLLLGLACAALQNFLGPVVQFPLLISPFYPLATSLSPIMHINQLAAYALALMACILVYRCRHPFGGFEQFSLFCVGIICAFLQQAVWNTDTILQRSAGVAIQQSQLYLIVIKKLLAQAFMLIVLTVLAIAISSVCLHLAREFVWIDRKIISVKQRLAWLDQFTLRLNHLILPASSITSLSLLWLCNSDTLQVMLKMSLAMFWHLMLSSLLIYFALFLGMLLLILVICAVVALMRMTRPFNRMDRGLILINSIACTLLLGSGNAQPTTLQDHAQITSVKPWLADPHIMLPPQGISCGLCLAVFVSLMWIKRRVPQAHRNMLKVGFGLTLACAMLQWLHPIFLLACLVMFTLSLLLAMQIEQI